MSAERSGYVPWGIKPAQTYPDGWIKRWFKALYQPLWRYIPVICLALLLGGCSFLDWLLPPSADEPPPPIEKPVE
jgi:hypothetical protein